MKFCVEYKKFYNKKIKSFKIFFINLYIYSFGLVACNFFRSTCGSIFWVKKKKLEWLFFEAVEKEESGNAN